MNVFVKDQKIKEKCQLSYKTFSSLIVLNYYVFRDNKGAVGVVGLGIWTTSFTHLTKLQLKRKKGEKKELKISLTIIEKFCGVPFLFSHGVLWD